MMRVLILGGTGDAAELAARVATIPGIEAIASLAGRTRQPSIPSGNIRQISFNAAAAATEVGIPRLILNRPVWEKVSGDRWIEVDNIAAAAAALANQAQRVFLTVGRQELSAFAHLERIWFLMRVIDPPNPDDLIPPGLVLCDRGPFALDNEREILIHHKIDTIVSKNSGGDATYAKIIAARELGVTVVMVNRPATPPGEQVNNVEDAVVWLLNKLHGKD